MTCQQRHQRVGGRKGNVYALTVTGATRLTGQSAVRSAIERGLELIINKTGTPGPTAGQSAGIDPLAAGALRIPAGSNPVLGESRSGRAVRALSATLAADGLDPAAFSALAASTWSIPGSTGPHYLIAAADAIGSLDTGRRSAVTAELTSQFSKLTSWKDPAGADRAVRVLVGAARHGAPIVRLAATTVVFDGPLTAGTAQVVSHADVATAIASGMIRPVFQGTYRRSRNGWEVTGAETLVRWQTGPDTWLAPPSFVEAAPDEIVALTLAASVDAATSWSSASRSPTSAFNVTPDQLGDNLVNAVRAQLEISGRTAISRVSVELTENGSITDPGAARRVLSQLAEMGVGAKLDDFGTAQSRIEGRRAVFAHIDVIKLDRSMVDGVSTDADKAAVVAVTVCAFPDKRVLAEGIERTDDLQALGALGIRDVQGYALARPVPVADFVLAPRSDISALS